LAFQPLRTSFINVPGLNGATASFVATAFFPPRQMMMCIQIRFRHFPFVSLEADLLLLVLPFCTPPGFAYFSAEACHAVDDTLAAL